MNTKKTTKNKGDYFESKAVDWLISCGFKIIDRNYYAKKMGEIDIIATKDNVYHFVEVKSGSSFEAVYNITPQKLYKLFKSIDMYIKTKNLDVSYCVDAIIFAGEELEYLPNISL